jgi:hypothetical protein
MNLPLDATFQRVTCASGLPFSSRGRASATACKVCLRLHIPSLDIRYLYDQHRSSAPRLTPPFQSQIDQDTFCLAYISSWCFNASSRESLISSQSGLSSSALWYTGPNSPFQIGAYRFNDPPDSLTYPDIQHEPDLSLELTFVIFYLLLSSLLLSGSRLAILTVNRPVNDGKPYLSISAMVAMVAMVQY